MADNIRRRRGPVSTDWTDAGTYVGTDGFIHKIGIGVIGTLFPAAAKPADQVFGSFEDMGVDALNEHTEGVTVEEDPTQDPQNMLPDQRKLTGPTGAKSTPQPLRSVVPQRTTSPNSQQPVQGGLLSIFGQQSAARDQARFGGGGGGGGTRTASNNAPPDTDQGAIEDANFSIPEVQDDGPRGGGYLGPDGEGEPMPDQRDLSGGDAGAEPNFDPGPSFDDATGDYTDGPDFGGDGGFDGGGIDSSDFGEADA